ncbi:MAG: carbohydrate kinase [Pyrinomonadaceae bacterium]
MTTRDLKPQLVLCFGEAVWDVFPEEEHPGGAPLNVAYHLSRLGYRAAPVTSVGKDGPGIKLLRQMTNWGLDTSFVTQTDHRLTGMVKVDLDPSGDAIYEVKEGIAWDRIKVGLDALKRAERSAAIVFGTLALREASNRRQLAHLLVKCPEALKVYDVNLRSPYTRPEIVWGVVKNADFVKLTYAELISLLPNATNPASIEALASQFSDVTGCKNVCVTSGAEGAGLLRHTTWYWAVGRPINVKDTVGAGDAFLAGLVHGFLSHLPPQAALENACRMGEFVASRNGATPAYKVVDIQERATGYNRQEGVASTSA